MEIRTKCPACGAEFGRRRDQSECPQCGAALPHTSGLTPELIEWAMRDYDEQEVLAQLREFELTGGTKLSDLIRDLERQLLP